MFPRTLLHALLPSAFAAGALLSGCADAVTDGDLADDTGESQYKPVSAADAFCPAGFAFDAGNELCLSATEAAGPFPASMVTFCKRWNPNRADGSNACETTVTGTVSTRWAKGLALDARTATRTSSGCAQGTTFDATAGYCTDGTNLFGPFTKDDVTYCKDVGKGGSACETNRIAKGLVRPKSGGFCELSWEERPGTADYTTINWYERSVGNERARTFDRSQAQTLQGSGRLTTDLCSNARILKTCFDRSVARDRTKSLPYLSWASARGLNPARMKMAFSYQETFLGNLHDDCVSGSCNGVGIAQIITAYPNDNDYSTRLSSSDARWDGISYNVLTNLTYSSRVLSAKILEAAPQSLVELARAYNGNPNPDVRLPYGTKVQRWYDELGACGVF